MEISMYGVAGYPGDVNPVPPPREEVELCKDWIKRWVTPRKTMNRAKNSYALKHAVENEIDRYIPNGAFIQAAIESGYRYKRCRHLSPNAYFNMSYGKVMDSIRHHFGSRNRRMQFQVFFEKMRRMTAA